MEFILDDIFNDRPHKKNDWKAFMDNAADLELPEGFEACQEYILDNARELRGLMQSKLDSLLTLATKLAPQKVFFVEQYDSWFSSSSKVLFGVFTSKEKALIEIGHNTDNFKKDYYENGTDQWMSDTLDCGIMIREVSLDKFGEL